MATQIITSSTNNNGQRQQQIQLVTSDNISESKLTNNGTAYMNNNMTHINNTNKDNHSSSESGVEEDNDNDPDMNYNELNNNKLSNGKLNQSSSVFIKCSAVHTLERDMPTFDYSHLVQELRTRILEEYSDEKNAGTFSEKDLEKCRTDDWYLSRYLLRQKLDVDAALEMLKKAMRFKYENLCHSIRVEDFPAEFYQAGGLFGYEPDRKGNLMLYIRVKIHRKIKEIAAVFQAFLFYNIERMDEKANGKGIALVFDCTGAGLVNADTDMLFMLISTLVNYFPKGFSYLLVHNIPWILKPIWALAKQMVSEEHRELVKFSDSRTIYEYVESDNLPDFMGGTCKRDYRQAPANCTTLEQAAKLWGIKRDVVKSILQKFSQYLPPETMEKFLANEKEFIEKQDDDDNDDDDDEKEE